MPTFATYGLLALAATAFFASFWIDKRPAGDRWAPLKKWTAVLQIGAVVGAYFVLRPGRGDDPNVALAQASADGKPVFVDLYSNF